MLGHLCLFFCVDIFTHGPKATGSKTSGHSPNQRVGTNCIIIIVCIPHHKELIGKKSSLKNETVKMIYFIKSQSLNILFFNSLCDKMECMHKAFLLNT